MSQRASSVFAAALRRQTTWCIGISLIASILVLAELLLAPAPAGAAPPPRQFMGVSTWSDLTDGDFRRLRGANVHVYRMTLRWKRVEPRQGAGYDWGYYDGLFRTAARRGVQILPVIHGVPRWVSSNTHYQPRNPTARKALRSFAAAAAKRYGPNGTLWSKAPWSSSAPAPSNVQAKYWQIWNEPNWSANWTPRPSPRAYGEMLLSVSRAIKGASPKARTMAAGLFWPASHLNAMSPERYVAELVRLPGLLSAVDAFAFHPYGKLPVNVLSRLDSARATLNRYGAARERIWVTEFGWASGRFDGAWTVREDQQARYLDDMYRKFLGLPRSYRLLGAIWFCYRDHARRRGQADYWGFRSGLLRVDGSAKPAWTVFSRRARSGF